MGFFNKEKAKERKAFRSRLQKQTTKVARKAYTEEALIVAAERARARARRKSFGDIIAERIRGNVESKIAGKPSVRRRATTKVVRRRAVRRVTLKQPTTLNEAIYG